MVPDYWPRAKAHLARRDKVLRRLIRDYPDADLRARGDAFQTLCRSIVGQQISVRAAQSIWGRFEAACGRVEPARIAALSVEALRGCGLSGRKTRYLLDLADHFHTGLVRPRRWARMADEAIIEDLVRVKGIGDLLVRFGVCCDPVPGDPIVGYITRGRGVTVHRADCSNVRNIAERERMVEVEWERTGPRTYPVAVRIVAWDRTGLVRDIASVISEDQVGLVSLSANTDDKTATVSAVMQVTSVEQLSRVLARLEGIRDVFSVSRDGR